MAPYPSRSEVEQLASHLGTSDPSPFFDRVSPDVIWDVSRYSLEYNINLRWLLIRPDETSGYGP